jgi:hypothetical protein
MREARASLAIQPAGRAELIIHARDKYLCTFFPHVGNPDDLRGTRTAGETSSLESQAQITRLAPALGAL